MKNNFEKSLFLVAVYLNLEKRVNLNFTKYPRD